MSTRAHQEFERELAALIRYVERSDVPRPTRPYRPVAPINPLKGLLEGIKALSLMFFTIIGFITYIVFTVSLMQVSPIFALVFVGIAMIFMSARDLN